MAALDGGGLLPAGPGGTTPGKFSCVSSALPAAAVCCLLPSLPVVCACEERDEKRGDTWVGVQTAACKL